MRTGASLLGGQNNAGPMQVVYSGAGVAVPKTFLATTFGAPRVSVPGLGMDQPVGAVSAAADTLTMLHGYPRPGRWDSVTLSSTGALPAPLLAGRTYYPRNVTTNTTFQLSATPDGPIIDLTSAGSGSISVQAFMTDLGLPPLPARGLDSGMPTWSRVHTAAGTFSWAEMDAYVDYHFTQRGRRLIFCFNSTPSWAARDQAADAYGSAGGGQVPADLNTGAAFVTALMQRYNSGANKPWMAIEAWNEPSFAATGTAGQNWCGTLAELAAFTRIINVAAKAVDPSIQILSPGFTNGFASTPPSLTDASMYGYLQASDGAAGKGKDWVDGVCYHGYDISDKLITELAAKVDRYRSYMAAAGLSANFPLYQTERGVADGSNEMLHIRCAAIEAALGVRMYVVYTADFYGVNPRVSTKLRAAMTNFYNTVCGKTITYCAINQDGSVTVTAGGVTQTF